MKMFMHFTRCTRSNRRLARATGLSLGLAMAANGVRVNSVAPGMMDTALQDKSERELLAIDGRDDLNTYLDERTARIPVGHRISTADVAAAVVYLALDAPEYVTAERMNISGGLDRD